MKHLKLHSNSHLGQTFPGFPPEPVTNFWPYPKALNGWWHSLTPWEQKVLDYILRHTWGFRKDSDAISLSQFLYGITKRSGTVLDKGTGIKDERTVRKAIKGLISKRFIVAEQTLGRETVFRLVIDPSHEMPPPTTDDTPPLTNNAANPLHGMSPTIDITIEDNNNIPASQEEVKSTGKGEITQLISYLSAKLGGVKFPNYGKQAGFAKSMLNSGYSAIDIRWAIDQMILNHWWIENGFDMKNVADQIPKLLVKGNKTPQFLSKPTFQPCGESGCESGFFTHSDGTISECDCRTKFDTDLAAWREQYEA